MSDIKIIEVNKEDIALQDVMKNLVKMYCCEWSTYNHMDVDDKGAFPFEPYLPSFFNSVDKKAFLVKYKDKFAGFALVDKDFCLHTDCDWSISEFFIMPKYRKYGIGRYLAFYLFDSLGRSFEIGRHPKNIPSVRFWDKVIAEYTNNHYESCLSCSKHPYFDGTLGDVLSFKK